MIVIYLGRYGWWVQVTSFPVARMIIATYPSAPGIKIDGMRWERYIRGGIFGER